MAAEIGEVELFGDLQKVNGFRGIIAANFDGRADGGEIEAELTSVLAGYCLASPAATDSAWAASPAAAKAYAAIARALQETRIHCPSAAAASRRAPASSPASASAVAKWPARVRPVRSVQSFMGSSRAFDRSARFLHASRVRFCLRAKRERDAALRDLWQREGPFAAHDGRIVLHKREKIARPMNVGDVQLAARASLRVAFASSNRPRPRVGAGEGDEGDAFVWVELVAPDARKAWLSPTDPSSVGDTQIVKRN